MLLHIQAFVNIYLCFKLHKHWPKSDKVIIGERIFWLKSVRRDPWSPMHIKILVDSSFGWFYPHFKFHWVRLAEKWRSYHQRKHFSTKISQAWPVVTHVYRYFNGLNFGLISTHISSFIEIGWKMTKLLSEKAIFLTKISQAWPIVTHAYWHFNGLKFGLISTHISNFYQNWPKND